MHLKLKNEIEQNIFYSFKDDAFIEQLRNYNFTETAELFVNGFKIYSILLRFK